MANRLEMHAKDCRSDTRLKLYSYLRNLNALLNLKNMLFNIVNAKSCKAFTGEGMEHILCTQVLDLGSSIISKSFPSVRFEVILKFV